MQVAPTSQQLREQNKATILEFKNHEGMPGWQKISDQPCDLYKMGIGNLMAAKGVATVNFPIDQVSKFIFIIGSFQMLDNTCIQEKCLFQENDVQVIYYKLNSPSRDLILSLCWQMENQNKKYLAAKSCNYPYPEEKGVIRAEAYIAGYIMEKIDQSRTKVTYMTFADLKGQVSQSTQNQLSIHQGGIAARIEEAMRNYGIN